MWHCAFKKIYKCRWFNLNLNLKFYSKEHHIKSIRRWSTNIIDWLKKRSPFLFASANYVYISACEFVCTRESVRLSICLFVSACKCLSVLERERERDWVIVLHFTLKLRPATDSKSNFFAARIILFYFFRQFFHVFFIFYRFFNIFGFYVNSSEWCLVCTFVLLIVLQEL